MESRERKNKRREDQTSITKDTGDLNGNRDLSALKLVAL